MSGVPPAPVPDARPPAPRSGRAKLHLDIAPVRLGSWLSGLVEVPERLHGSDIRLFVECVRDRYRLKTNPDFLWLSIALLDGTRLERQADKAFIPFAVRLPVDAPPTSHDTRERVRVDWRLCVQALRSGRRFAVTFEEAFEIVVPPPDASAPPAPAPPPRTMPELTQEQLALRLRAKAERVDDALVIHFPFPAGAATTALVGAAVFAANGLAYFVPGLPWALPAASELPLAVAVVSGGLTAVMLLVLLMTTRTLEVRPQTVRFTRGILGLGFHRSLPTRDVAEVVENPSLLPNASPRYYGVALRMRDGALHGAATRMRDPADARALALLLASVLPQA